MFSQRILLDDEGQYLFKETACLHLLELFISRKSEFFKSFLESVENCIWFLQTTLWDS